MDKNELVNITLKQLLESLKDCPECFELEDKEITPDRSLIGPIIIWRFRCKVNGEIVNDPNNPARTIMVSFNNIAKSINCSIYLREVTSYNLAIMPDTQVSITYKWHPMLYSGYRNFMKIRKALLERHKQKLNDAYLDKLQSIFPSTFTDELLK